MNRTILSYSICTIAALLLLCYLTSCNTPQRSYKRGYKKITKGALISPQAAAAFCAITYPVVAKTDTNIKYLPGETIWADPVTKYVNCDSLTDLRKSGKNVNTSAVPVDCPPSGVRVDSFYLIANTTVVNTAEIKAANIERDNYKAEVIKYKSRSKGNFVWACSVSALLLIIIIIWVLKKVYWNKATKLV